MFTQLWDLFIAFTRASNLGFGGGPAVIPLIKIEVVERYHWLTNSGVALLSQYSSGIYYCGINAIWLGCVRSDEERFRFKKLQNLINILKEDSKERSRIDIE
jgi:hypothetical protein